MNAKVPLDIEETLDLVLAAAAHRSSNDKHAGFGKMLLGEYFVKLRERYKSDEVACRYLDNLLACASSAVRAFSVERDIFGTRWESLSRQRQYAIDRANRLDSYSPFRESGIWGKFFSILGGGGLGGVVSEVLRTWLGQSSILLLSCISFGIFVGLFAFDLFLNLYRQRLIAKVERDFPKTLEESWRQQTLEQYKLILRKFLLSAIKVREQWYPDLPTFDGKKVFDRYMIPYVQFTGENEVGRNAESSIDELWGHLDKIIERHISFR